MNYGYGPPIPGYPPLPSFGPPFVYYGPPPGLHHPGYGFHGPIEPPPPPPLPPPHFHPNGFPPRPGFHHPQPNLNPVHPPRPAPPAPRPDAPISSPTSPVTPTVNKTQIHPFWKRLLAPLPGSSSPANLFAAPALSKAIPIIEPAQLNRRKRRELRRRQDSQNGVVTNGNAEQESTVSVSSPSNGAQEPFQMDKYANIFVPQYLKDIQKQPQNFQPLAPLPLFPPPSFIQEFAPLSLVEPSTSKILAEEPPSDDDEDFECPALLPETYYEHFLPLLQQELRTVSLIKADIVLWKVSLTFADPDTAIKQSGSHTVVSPEFALFVPGIRENHPRLHIGDLVHLREVLENWQTGSGMAFEGRITALRRREGIIQIRAPGLKQHIQIYRYLPSSPTANIPMIFNASFMTNASPFFAMDIALSSMGAALSEEPTESSQRSLALRWLFPEPQDLDHRLHVPVPIPIDAVWDDIGLNEEQKTAAFSIARHRSPVPFLVAGPPGTGKTRTIVEAVQQIIRVNPHARILLCAPSNSATDTLAFRLAVCGLKPTEMLRLNDRERTFAEVPQLLRMYCAIKDEKFAIPPFKKLMQYKVVVTSCGDADILATARCTNRTLGKLEELVSQIHPERSDDIEPHWTHLLIDEAAQASEPELLIPISVVHAEYKDPAAVQFVLCGDSNQLGPILASPTAIGHELNVSLLERLFERPLYKNHPLARGNTMRSRSSASVTSEMIPFANLVKNYRSHPGILMPPSAIFYNDSLQPCAKNGTVGWSGLPNRDIPLLFINCNSPEESNNERATWFNSGEISMVVETAQGLLSQSDKCSPPLRSSEIGVMAPWREQVWKLRKSLREAGLHSVDVGSVEDYQGRENRVIIISCVRSNARFLEDDMFKGHGLMFDRKRMNVAITRAKELLVVIGNGELLKKDPYWKSFLQFVVRNKLIRGPALDIEDDGSYISRLESEMVNKRIETGTVVDEEEHGLLIAGGMVRELLREEA